ncbi:prolyl oligopeptidase family serine peptidase [Spirosoma gilvum]
MKKIGTLLLIFLPLLAKAQNTEMDVDKVAIQSSKYWLDVDYAGDSHIGHRLDIHLPKTGKAPFPVVVCIYGSAWFSNSAKETTFSVGLGQKLLSSGFAVVNINHRSSSDAKFPAQIQDVKAAIRFIRANASRFGLDNSFIGITGWSSGGHLSSLTGTTNGIEKTTVKGLEVDIEGSIGKFTQTSSHVNAVVDWFGPTDFLIMDQCGSSFSHNEAKSPESSLIGGPIQENPAKCALASPMSYVRNDTPPFLIFHGDKDPLVPHCQSEKLYERLQQEKVKSQLVIVPGGGHGPGVMIDTYYDRMLAFFTDQLKAGKKK